jgi:hypothetical protein
MATINLKEIEVTTETQVREKICESTVDEYAKAMQEGASFPPIELIEEGPIYLIADGHHRYEAAKKIGLETIEANLREGTVRDAILVGLTANHNHGLRLSLGDRRRMVSILLNDQEWCLWSNAEIAKKCSCSVELVAKIRSTMGVEKEITSCLRRGKPIEIRTPSQAKHKPLKVYPSEIGGINEQQIDPKEIEREELLEALEVLKEENAKLSDRLAIAALEGTEEEKGLADKTIQELRSEVRQLHIQLESVIQSRDSYQSEKAQMQAQLNRYTREWKKCTCKAKDKLEQAA